MAHKVNFYDIEAGFDSDGFMRPVAVIETEDSAVATRLVTDAIARSKAISAASLSVDHTLCADLSEYLRLTNSVGRWLAENPIEGAWIGMLTEDLTHWHEMGVHTPEDLVKYEMLATYSDYHKEMRGFRPRGTGLTMASPLAEIEAAWDALRLSNDRDNDISF